MSWRLKDPASAQWAQISGPSTAWQDVLGGKRLIGWRACFAINAKNSFGGYTGQKRHVFFYRDGAVLMHFVEDPGGLGLANVIVDRHC